MHSRDEDGGSLVEKWLQFIEECYDKGVCKLFWKFKRKPLIFPRGRGIRERNCEGGCGGEDGNRKYPMLLKDTMTELQPLKKKGRKIREICCIKRK